MAINRTLKRWLESGDFEAVEDDWLSRVEGDPSDLDYFVGAARALAGTGQEERAATLLELVDEALRDSRAWETRLALLRGAGHLMLPAASLHAEILNTLGELYRDYPSLEGLIEKVGLRRAIEDIPKVWTKVERLRELLQFELGSVVLMEGKGAGRVEEVNLELESFKVDFPRHPGLRVGFRAAGKLLRALSSTHVLRRKLEEPEALRGLEPGRLLQVVLESYERPLAAAEIREAVEGVVPQESWTSWWAAARKHPQVLAGGSGRRLYRWAGSSEDAQRQSQESFERAGLEGKLEIFRREASRLPRLAEGWTAELTTLAGERAESAPADAFAIWCELERAGRAPAGAPWSAQSLVRSCADLPALIRATGGRPLRERALGLTRELRADWPSVFRAVLHQEEDPRTLDLIAEALAAEGREELEGFYDQLLARPTAHPAAFVWLAERVGSDSRLERRNPLRLLRQVLGAERRSEFAPFRARLRRLYERGRCLAALISGLGAEQAERAAEALKLAPLESHVREPLLNALQLRFPELRQPEEGALYAIGASVEARRAELRKLVEEELPANRKAIEEARALGDLRENFEYKAARQRHEYLSARVAALNRDLERVRIIDPTQVNSSEVRVGSRVELQGEEDRRLVTILGPWESDPERDVISYDAELGQVLLGRKPGEEIQLSGERLKITRIEPWVPGDQGESEAGG